MNRWVSSDSVRSVATTGSGPSWPTNGRLAPIVVSCADVSPVLSVGSSETDTAGAGFGEGLLRSPGELNPSSAAVKPSTATQ